MIPNGISNASPFRCVVCLNITGVSLMENIPEDNYVYFSHSHSATDDDDDFNDDTVRYR